MVRLPTPPELAQGPLPGNQVPRPHMDKIRVEGVLMPSQLALGHLLTALRLLLVLELQPGEELQPTHQLLRQHTTHLPQVGHTMIFQLHMAGLRLLRRQLRLPDTETKRRHQQRLKGQIENLCGTTGLTHRHQGTMLLHQPQMLRHLLHMEAVTTHQRQLQGLEMGLGTLTAMRSRVG